MKTIKFCLSVFILLVFSQKSISQSSIPVGSGSYASYPPTNEYINGEAANGSFYDVAVNTSFNVGTAFNNQPIPTNDWYTSVVHGSENGLGGQLWSLPLMVHAKTTGLNVYHRGQNHWGYDAMGSATLSADFNISIMGSGFAPTNTILENAGDWHTEMSLKEGSSTSQRIDFTLGLGMPYVWAHCVGFTPQIQAYHPGVRNYYDVNSNNLSFPVTTDRFVIEYDGQLFGVHLSQNVNITTNDGGSTLTLNGYSNNWVVISALNSSTDLDYMHTYAFVRPTATTVDYDYNSTTGAVNVSYNISKTNIIGSQANLLQGFMPHHYRGNTNNFSFTSKSYNYTPRGIIKLAAGTSFNFDYTFNGNILPAFKLPGTSSGYSNTRMNTIIDKFWANIQSGDLPMRDGTYWGGKDLVRLLKYTQFAKETGNSNYSAMLSYSRDVFIDWATYTPGETERYFAYYPAWKGLVGFNEEFYSGYFTDNHFHLGYFVHAAALLDILSPGAIDDYWPIVEEVAKGYANWDKTDTDHLYFRTFNPFLGYSFADGRGNSIGNNQESSSESMQSWAAMFMVSQMTGNTSMQKAAAFGLTMESRAVADYWYNEGGAYSGSGYTKPITGILEMNRFVYGTFFGAEETFLHGIQWLPISPFYSLWNDFLTVSEANALVDPLLANIENDLSARGEGDLIDWTNVLWGFKMFFDPDNVVSQFESKWNAAPGTTDYNITHTPGENGITYYYSHALSELGIRNTEYRLSLPLGSAFENGSTVNYVVYNPSSSLQTCNVYKNNTFVTSFSVPANTLYSSAGGTTIPVTGVTVSPTSKTLLAGETQQLTTTVSPANASNQNISWSTSNASVATVSTTGLVTAESTGNVTITVTTEDGNFTADCSITVESNNVLPSPWETADVGNVAAEGSASYNSGTFTIEGSGADIWGTSDEFRSVHQPIDGDVVITAKVNSLSNTDAWAKAGVMIRESLTDASKHAFTAVTAGNGTAFQRRETTNGNSSHTAGPSASAPYWVKLERSGDTFTSSVSADGINWTVVGSNTISMSNTAYIGLAITSHNDGTLCSSQISDVTINTGTVNYAAVPGTIQAEDYTDMLGIQTEVTSDVGGGFNVGWIDQDDWIDYDVNVSSTGTYKIKLRGATPNGPDICNVLIDNTVIGNIDISNTGGWQEWQTFETTVSLTEGTHTLRLYAATSGFNINWVEFTIDNQTSNCTVEGATGDYTAEISNDASNPTITFIPARTGVGSSVCILYYGTIETGGLPGYNVTPNVPYQISAQNGEHIYFYYTYSLPEGGENNTAGARNDFTVGNCSSLKSASVNNEALSEVKDKIFVDKNIRVYPNPAHSMIKVSGIKNATELSIYSLTGKELLIKKGSFGDEASINIESLNKGIYFVKIKISNEVKTKLFVKK